MKKLGDLMMILDLHRQGVKIAAIARQVGIDRKTVRKYIGRGIEVPTDGPRQPRERLLDPHLEYLRARLPGGGNLFVQLVNARYEKGAMILTSNRGFAEWGDIFGSPVVATALLDRLLHHANVIQIDGSSYRLRRHADLLPEHIRSNARITPPALVEPKRRGRPPKHGGAALTT